MTKSLWCTYVNGPKKQHFELLKDGAKEESHILVHIMPLITAVIMPVQIFTYVYTQISSSLRTVTKHSEGRIWYNICTSWYCSI